MTQSDKVLYWHNFFINRTNGFLGPIYEELSLLYPAMLKSDAITVLSNSPLVDMLKECDVGPKAEIWQYIHITE